MPLGSEGVRWANTAAGSIRERLGRGVPPWSKIVPVGVVAVLIALAGLSVQAAASAGRVPAAQVGTAGLSWGQNGNTDLGAGYKDNYEAGPVSVLGLTNVAAIAAGYHFSLALLSDATVTAWGGNDYGQLGNGTRERSAMPTPVSGLSNVKAVGAGGTHAVALLTSEAVMVWGSNEYGELGNGELNPRERTNTKGEKEATMIGTGSTEPVEVPGLKNVVAVALGGGTDYALLENGTLMAWGRNDFGQLGIGVIGPEACKTFIGVIPCSTKPRPVALSALPEGVKVTEVFAGAHAAYALLSNGEVRAWGHNTRGALGDGSTTDSDVPVEVLNERGQPGKNLSGVTAIAGGSEYALARLQSGRVVGWGANAVGQLGASTTDECNGRPDSCSKTPIAVGALENVTALSAGPATSFALSSGQLYAFGRNSPWGQLGDDSVEGPEACGIEGSPGHERTLWCSRSPKLITGFGTFGAVAAGQQHSVAVLKSGSGPPPLLSVSGEARAVRVVWTVAASEYRLRSKPLGAKRWGRKIRFKNLVCSATAPCSYSIPDEGGPIEIDLNSREAGQLTKRRLIVGAPVPAAGKPRDTTHPMIQGVAELGGVLVEKHGVWTNTPTIFAYQWLRCDEEGESCKPIAGATHQTYVPQALDAGHVLRVEETAVNGNGATIASSEPIRVIAEEPEEPEEAEGEQ
jgi:alpha-tubulin suppressor-like RCC1 family protein